MLHNPRMPQRCIARQICHAFKKMQHGTQGHAWTGSGNPLLMLYGQAGSCVSVIALLWNLEEQFLNVVSLIILHEKEFPGPHAVDCHCTSQQGGLALMEAVFHLSRLVQPRVHGAHDAAMQHSSPCTRMAQLQSQATVWINNRHQHGGFACCLQTKWTLSLGLAGSVG